MEKHAKGLFIPERTPRDVLVGSSDESSATEGEPDVAATSQGSLVQEYLKQGQRAGIQLSDKAKILLSKVYSTGTTFK